MIRVGLNGFGRIGRAVFRINHAQRRFEIVAVNDLDPDVANHAYLLKYDSTYGRLVADVSVDDGAKQLVVDGNRIPFYAESNIVNVPWADHQVDVIIDASGVFDNVAGCSDLVKRTEIKKAIVTHSPRKGVDGTFVFGVNEEEYDFDAHHVISTSICDANATAPILKALDTAFGVEQGYITTLHPWLSYQNLLDGSVRSVSNPGHYWGDFSLGRASTDSLIPKGTTLVSALEKVLPELAQRLDAISFRVPTGIVSAADMSIQLKTDVRREDVEGTLRGLAEKSPTVVELTNEQLVSVDFRGVGRSVAVDGRWIRASGRAVKVVLWYDNEWGYSSRVVDAVPLVLRQAVAPQGAPK